MAAVRGDKKKEKPGRRNLSNRPGQRQRTNVQSGSVVMSLEKDRHRPMRPIRTIASTHRLAAIRIVRAMRAISAVIDRLRRIMAGPVFVSAPLAAAFLMAADGRARRCSGWASRRRATVTAGVAYLSFRLFPNTRRLRTARVGECASGNARKIDGKAAGRRPALAPCLHFHGIR